jgi:hydroxymethylbilane synthase
MLQHLTQWLPVDVMLPAPGQGALAVQCRTTDETTLGLLAGLDDISTRNAVTAERAFLSGLGGGCAVPVAAYAEEGITLTGLVISEDGEKAIRVKGEGADALQLGNELAQAAISQGAAKILSLRVVK